MVRATTRLRTLLASGRIAVAPGAYDGLSARLVEQAGFPAIYASGGAIARSAGVPDLGLISVSAIVDRLAAMVDVVEAPVVADADTGYGNALNAQAAARAFERAGVAALHLEDQTFPKKCGHYDDKSLVAVGEMVQKLKVVRDVLHDPDFVVIARTDARGVNGFDDAVARARLYLEAGADAIFPEALESAQEFAAFAQAVPAPLLANMTEFGRTPFFTAAEFEAMGYRMVIWPVSSLRVANKAQETLYAAIARDGGAHGMIDQMQTRAELYATIGLHDYESLDASIVESVVPEAAPGR